MMSLASRLRASRLYLCTDARERQGDLADFLRAAFAGGVDVVQIRQKDMARDAELAALEVARSAAVATSGIVCVNDSPRIAKAFAADMLHLGQTDGSARKARRSLHEWALVGRSTHTPEQADEAAGRAEFLPAYRATFDGIGRERGWPTMSDATVEALLAPEGALFFGHPERVADKIVALARTLGLQRFEMHAAHVGHAATMRSIELFGTQVAPLVAERLSA